VPSPVDEVTAWRLLRAVVPQAPGELVTTTTPHNASCHAPLQIDERENWTLPGPVSDAAKDLLDLYLPLQLSSDLIIGQIGQSVDGRIATESGHSHYVTGPEDRIRLHRLRAIVDAVVVGAGTVESDDPQLTVRHVDGPSPVRVVLDPNGRVSRDRTIFHDGIARTLTVRRNPNPAEPPTMDGEDLWLPHDGEKGFAPDVLIAALRDQGLRRLLVEGGGVTVSRFLQARCLNRLHVTIAPLLIGSGRPALALPPIATLGQALRPPYRLFRLGHDVLFDLDLR
jgi:riboflavin-specific deaminase-like protein